MSSGKKTEQVQQTAQSGPPSWAQPYFQQAFGMAGNLANQQYIPYDGARTAGFSNDQTAAMNATRKLATTPSADVTSANTYVNNILNGKGVNPYMGKTTAVGTNAYAGANSYLPQMIQDAQKDVTTAYRDSQVPELLSQFNNGGAYGGTAMADSKARLDSGLADQLGSISTNLRFQDYTTQQQLAEADINRRLQAQQGDLSRNSGLYENQAGRQLQAAGMAPGLDQARYYGADRLAAQGALQQGWMQGAIDKDYNDYTDQRDWQGNRLSLLTNALGSLNGGTTSSSTSNQANPNYKSAGQNAAGYAALLASLWG